MPGRTHPGQKAPRKSMAVNDLQPVARQSARHSGVHEQKPPAEPSRSATRRSTQRQGGGKRQKPGRNEEHRLAGSETATKSSKVAGQKRKAPLVQQQQQPAAPAGAVRPDRRSERRRGRETPAEPARPAAPRQVAVLGRSRTTGRRPTDSVTWDGETYSVCGLPAAVAAPLLAHAASHDGCCSPRGFTHAC